MAEHVFRPQSSSISPAPASTATPPAAGVSPPAVADEAKPKIHGFGHAKTTDTVESKWKRPLQKSGTGATHVRTFSGSLTQHGLEFLDRHINEWLDTHPDAEVKFASLQVGDMPTATGREPALIAQVWI
jgi:hypothetical protein